MAERASLAIEPLGAWSAADDGPARRSTMTVDGVTSLHVLAVEAGRIGATLVDVELDVDPASIRADGSALRGNRAGPRSGRVRATLRFGDARPPMVLRTSNVTGLHAAPWELSLRSITATLESLRGIDRYGVLNAGQQYEGLKALPPGTAMGGGSGKVRSMEWARAALIEMTGLPDDTGIGDLLRVARHYARTDGQRERLAEVRAVVSGEEATREREDFEAWRRERDASPAEIEAGASSAD